jgi:exodeoxyribonuclease V alpha subunit
VSSLSEDKKITVTVERILYSNDQGYAILTVCMEPHQKKTRIRGVLPGVGPGQRLTVTGQWIQDKRHGRQFQVETWEECLPENKRTLVKFLAAHMDGIGPKLAGTIVASLGEKTLEILEQTPSKLKKIPGIGPRKYQSILKAWGEYRSTAQTHLFLKSLDLGPVTSMKLFRMYGAMTETLMRENPYRLAREVRGIGFSSADRIAGRLDIPPESPCRIEAGILYELMNAEEEGHCYVKEEELLVSVAQRLQLPGKTISDQLMPLLNTGEIIRWSDRDGNRLIFSRRLNQLENELAGHLVRIVLKKNNAESLKLTETYLQVQQQSGLTVDPDQQRAVEVLARSALMVLTGGPGTGKTTLVKVILRVFKHWKTALAAPTGRAAQRLQDATGHPASTLHRLLDFHPDTGFFGFHSKNPLPADVIIVDESSMLDVPLATSLLRAAKDGCRLILVGDADQLPSVGPGSVFKDIIQSGLAEVVRLKRIFRQSENSRIVQNAHHIIRGKMPDPGKKDDRGDFFFIEKDDPDEIVDILKRLPSRLAAKLRVDPVDGIQVLCPMYRGRLGVDRLNEILRESLNGDGRSFTWGGKQYRTGDKVMQIRNNYDLDVFNGDVGRIIAFHSGQFSVTVRFGNRRIIYTKDQADQLVPAFACTVHKSQGSEYPGVIMLVHTQHYLMLTRSILYTAVTRGRRMVVCLGSKRALAIAVRQSRIKKRNTRLVQRIRGKLKAASR